MVLPEGLLHLLQHTFEKVAGLEKERYGRQLYNCMFLLVLITSTYVGGEKAEVGLGVGTGKDLKSLEKAQPLSEEKLAIDAVRILKVIFIPV